MHESPHELARLNKSANYSDLWLCEECLPDGLERSKDIHFPWSLIVKSTESDHFLLEESSQLWHTARKLHSHILLDLRPRLHSFYLVHNDGISISQCFEKDAWHPWDSQHSCWRLFYALKVQKHLDLEPLHWLSSAAQLVNAGSQLRCGFRSESLSHLFHLIRIAAQKSVSWWMRRYSPWHWWLWFWSSRALGWLNWRSTWGILKFWGARILLMSLFPLEISLTSLKGGKCSEICFCGVLLLLLLLLRSNIKTLCHLNIVIASTMEKDRWWGLLAIIGIHAAWGGTGVIDCRWLFRSILASIYAEFLKHCV